MDEQECILEVGPIEFTEQVVEEKRGTEDGS